ncbi:HD domain containing protein [Paecilomyces variotii No. 5]|uniref:HD domain containing protein n=1 Tax=Byssochlamys spectabilis (strain No. 5 / NBRC 109023) TaxID=1356009 RepID=V5I4Q1_BYSSN|nr:HD domain containing protein [Paecilomyces variotii No. 5]
MSSVFHQNQERPTKKKSTMADPVEVYGFTPVPSSAEVLKSSTLYPAPYSPPPPISVSDIPIPSTPIAQRIHDYAKLRLPEPTYNHSMRVYLYGIAMKRYRFPSWTFTEETYFLSCLLHDIGTTEENLHRTHLSFEFYGGILALEVLQSAGAIAVASDVVAPREQAESVTEAIIRHQDLCQKGKITVLGQLLQLATIFDNTGTHSELVHRATIADVTKHYPRLKWSDCFTAVIHRENSLKPWAHTTTLGEEEFPAKVQGNKLMAEYE